MWATESPISIVLCRINMRHVLNLIHLFTLQMLSDYPAKVGGTLLLLLPLQGNLLGLGGNLNTVVIVNYL